MKIESYESYIVILPQEGERESSLGIKALKNAETTNLIKPVSVSMNGKNQIIYPSEELILTDGVDENRLEENKKLILSALGEVLRIVDNSEFLERNYIVLDENYIYYSAKEHGAKFIVAPFESKTAKETAERNATWMKRCIEFVERLTGNVGKVKSDNIYDFLGSRENEVTNETSDIGTDATELVLRYNGTYGHFSLYDSANEYRIGSNNELEGTISFNPSISREHCLISLIKGAFYIKDTNSTNGTFLNGQRLSPDEIRPLTNGDRVMFSDMEFTVEIK